MNITEAVIAGVATILASIITLLIKEYLDKRKESYKRIDDQIRDVVYGKWKGTFQQVFNDSLQTIDFEMELKVSSRGKVIGTGKYLFENEVYVVNISGGFYSNRFLKMDYENSNKAILQFGSFVFKLSDGAKTLNGHFVGYGHLSGKVIGGNAILHKL